VKQVPLTSSIRINDQWRICLRRQDGTALDVKIVAITDPRGSADGVTPMSIARNELKHQGFMGITTGRRLNAVHPGSVLLADFIEPMGITRYRVAKAIGVQQRRIGEIQGVKDLWMLQAALHRPLDAPRVDDARPPTSKEKRDIACCS